MFKYKIGDTYYSLEELSGWNTWDGNGSGKLTLNTLGTYSVENGEIKKQSLILARPLEDWRSITIPGYQVYSSTTKTYEPLKVLQAESIPNPNNLIITITSPTVTIYPNSDKTQLIVDFGGETTQNLTIKSKEDSSKSIIPSWIIFELQAGGGGGGGSGSTIVDSKNGAGGGGGGYISGLLKLNFSIYPKYEIQIGSGGAGGTGASGGGTSGASGGGSYIYGVNSNGLKTLLVAAYGGSGGISNNASWDDKSPADGGTASVKDSNYIKMATSISGGSGGKTNDQDPCHGTDIANKKIYYLESTFAQYYNNSYFYKETTTQTGGAAGSSNHSGGGGASALGPGGAGGGTSSDGNTPTSGFGGGGGGGRWTLYSPKNGGNGKGGCCKLYY